jgi:hypothetical protein
MTPGEALKTILHGVTAYDPMPGREAPGAVPPFIVYIAFGPKNYGGVAGQLSAVQPCRVQLDLYADTYLGVQAVVQAAEAAMGAYSGNGSAGGAVPVCCTQLTSHYVGEDAEVNLHRHMLEFSMWYKP